MASSATSARGADAPPPFPEDAEVRPVDALVEIGELTAERGTARKRDAATRQVRTCDDERAGHLPVLVLVVLVVLVVLEAMKLRKLSLVQDAHRTP